MPGKPGSVEDRIKERDEYIPKSVKMGTPIFAESAKGHKIRDVDGKEYVDFTGGIGVLNTGHLPDAVTAAVRAQLDKYLLVGCARAASVLDRVQADLEGFDFSTVEGKTAFFN